MPRIDTYSCEPFRAWNRLEPRTRTAEFDRVLQAGVHDALWMLTRQWQFGEFQGEDTGSAIFAKILMQTTNITRFKTANGTAQAYSDVAPLEARIERQPYRFDYKCKIEAAFAFLNSLDNIAAQLGGVAGYTRKLYKSRLNTLYQLPPVNEVQDSDTDETILSKLQTLSNENYVATAGETAGRYFDGLLLYNAILADKPGTINVIIAGNVAHTTLVTQAVTAYQSWFERTYDLSGANNTAWVPRQLEYQFDCALPDDDHNNTVLTAKEYYSGELDWYAFDINNAQAVAGITGAADSTEMTRVKDELLTVIPVEAKFAGAPNSRWWQFENGGVDLGDINAEATDIAKMVFTEYALLYNNDWLLVPYRVPVGTLCEVKGIVVKDVFGEQWFIEPATQGETDNWAGWGMYNLSKANPDGARNLPVDTRLFVPPAVVKNMESEPVEEVHFVRDEMTNNIWAIETKLPDNLGSSVDGHNVARNFQEQLELWDLSPVASPAPDAMFRYLLANTVPDNWIPFIPVHKNAGNRDIHLQRASMPRLFRNNYSHIRPRTQLLRHGIDDTGAQLTPYFINEEEVPRAGVQLRGTFQRARWYNGKVVNWYGYRKLTGRGEGSSGLLYDNTDPVRK